MIVVVEIEAAVDSVGTVEKFLFSTEGWTTLPADTPANTHVQPRLIQAANYRRELFSGARTFGAVRSAYGECKLANLDGKLDAFARYGFDGRSYRLWFGEKGAAFPSAFTCVLTATMKCALFEMTQDSGAVRILLRDRLVDLEKPVASESYAGTGDEEGTATATSGARKPRTFGTIFSCKPQLVDENLLIYAIGAPPLGYETHPFRMQDGGDNITPYPINNSSFDYPTYADLANAEVPAGAYAKCRSLGLIKLGLKPTFDLSCVALVSDSARTDESPSKPGTILRQLAIAAGVAGADIVSSDVAALDSARPASYGYRCANEETALSVMAKVAGSTSAWFGFDALGKLRMGIFDSPNGAPAFTFNQHNITKIQRLDSEETGVPVWKVTARCAFNFSPQTVFAGSVPAWYAQWFDKEWPKEVAAENSSIKLKHPGAGELIADAYTSAMDDHGEAARRLALYGVERDLVQIAVPVTTALLTTVDLAKVVSLKYPRFGWDAGKLMRVVAITINLDAMRAEIILWG